MNSLDNPNRHILILITHLWILGDDDVGAEPLTGGDGSHTRQGRSCAGHAQIHRDDPHLAEIYTLKLNLRYRSDDWNSIENTVGGDDSIVAGGVQYTHGIVAACLFVSVGVHVHLCVGVPL